MALGRKTDSYKEAEHAPKAWLKVEELLQSETQLMSFFLSVEEKEAFEEK
jgi:hypothetical protein